MLLLTVVVIVVVEDFWRGLLTWNTPSLIHCAEEQKLSQSSYMFRKSANEEKVCPTQMSKVGANLLQCQFADNADDDLTAFLTTQGDQTLAVTTECQKLSAQVGRLICSPQTFVIAGERNDSNIVTATNVNSDNINVARKRKESDKNRYTRSECNISLAS